jgi:hypothetical protein
MATSKKTTPLAATPGHVAQHRPRLLGAPAVGAGERQRQDLLVAAQQRHPGRREPHHAGAAKQRPAAAAVEVDGVDLRALVVAGLPHHPDGEGDLAPTRQHRRPAVRALALGE